MYINILCSLSKWSYTEFNELLQKKKKEQKQKKCIVSL